MKRTYDFPGGKLNHRADGTYCEHPHWCPMLCVKRDRAYVLEALRELRRRRHQPDPVGGTNQ